MSKKKGKQKKHGSFLKKLVIGLVAGGSIYVCIITVVFSPVSQNIVDRIFRWFDYCRSTPPHITDEAIYPPDGSGAMHESDASHPYECSYDLDVFIESSRDGNKVISEAWLCVDEVEEFVYYNVNFDSSCRFESYEPRAYVINNCFYNLVNCQIEFGYYTYDNNSGEEHRYDLTNCFGVTEEEKITQGFNVLPGEILSYTVLSEKEDYLINLCKKKGALEIYAALSFDGGYQTGTVGFLSYDEDGQLRFNIIGDGEPLFYGVAIDTEAGAGQQYPLNSTKSGDRIVGASFEHNTEIVVKVLPDKTCRLTVHAEYTIGDETISTEPYTAYVFCPVYNSYVIVNYMIEHDLTSLQYSPNLPSKALYSPEQFLENDFSD